MTIHSEFIRSAPSLPQLFFATASRVSTSPAQWYRGPEGYVPISYERLASRIRHVASGLIRIGVKPGERVGLLMENRPEWAVCDYAILSVGAVTVPLYCSFRPQDMAFVLENAGVHTVFASGGKVLKHLLEAINSCSGIKSVYAIEGITSDEVLLHDFSELESGEVDESGLKKRMQKLTRDTLATLVYTSGTTANPKGVMLSHGNLMANLEAVPNVVEFGEDDKMLSFLPLAHSLERMAGHFLPYSFGISVAFAERPDTVAKNMAEARPTVLVTVPRMLEVVMNRIRGQVAKQPAVKRRMFYMFLRLARKASRGSLSWLNRVVYGLLDQLVGQKVRDRFGGRLRFMVSGGAPLGVDVAEFFEGIGLRVMEGYGLTESSPLISVNPYDDRRLGTIGKVVEGVEVKIAEDGEILARGANIMQGYWKLPKETRATVIEGWLHTGDIGEIDTDGYIRITDRKKDIIVNSGGENIAPQRIESLLVSDNLIEQVVVYGDKKPYLVALIVPAREGCEAWAMEQGLPRTAWEDLAVSDILRKELQNRISKCLSGLSQHEQVRRLAVHFELFSIDNGLLTPTMKIKRRKVNEQFLDIFEELYS
ncbi:MAG: AMP-dependent synthetase/ligase [Mariprofundaceae bacterium]